MSKLPPNTLTRPPAAWALRGLTGLTVLLPALQTTLAQTPSAQMLLAQSRPAALAAPSALTLVSPPPLQAAPGDYATLMFRASGQGDYDMTVDAGPDWVPVSSSRKLSFSGHTLVPVTFRIPAGAPVGPSPAVTMQLSSGSKVMAQAQTHFDVLPQAKLVIRAPDSLSGQPRRPLNFEVQVTNQGNQDDTVNLRITNIDKRPQLSTGQLRLRAGQTASVGVSLSIEDAAPGYLYLVGIEGQSQNNPDLKIHSRTDVIFNPVGQQLAQISNQPQLVFSVQSSIETGIDWTPTGRQTYFNYALGPRLSGQLSDYVAGDAFLAGVQGSKENIRPRGLNFGLRLSAHSWDLLATGGQGGAALGGNLYRWGWRLSPRFSWTHSNSVPELSGGLGASGPLLGGTMDSDISATYHRGDGQNTLWADQLSLRYSRSLSPQTAMVLGGVGYGQSGVPGHHFSGLGYEQLTYASSRLDLTQSYSGTLSGLHSFSVSGGLTSLRPYSARAALSVLYQPRGVTYSGSGFLGYAAASGLGLSAGGYYQQSTLTGTAPAWNVFGSLHLPTLLWKSGGLSTAAAYTLSHSPDLLGGQRQKVAATAALTSGRLLSNLNAVWERSAEPNGKRQQTLSLDLIGTYQLRSADLLGTEYHFQRQQGSSESTTNALHATWTHHWTPHFEMAVDYQRRWTTAAQQTLSPEAAGISFELQDLLIQGLTAQAGYYAAAPYGLGRGNLSSGVKLALNYSLDWTLNTPQAMTKLFGGRLGGEVSGKLYQDTNYNGQRDPGEPGLPGVTVMVGGVRATTGSDGSYLLRVPVGTFKLSYVSGIPATMESLTDDSVSVKANSVNRLDVPFAPVVQAEVLVYDDTNHNGQRDPGEAALPYVGVNFSGAASRTVQGDSSGTARLSALPPGQYLVGLNPAQLPEGYVPTTASTPLVLVAGTRPAPVEMGAAAPLKQNVTTFTVSNIALFGSLGSETALPGSRVQVRLQVQRADILQITAFGQTFAPPLKDNHAALDLLIPSNLTPGSYDITVTAQRASATKSTVLKLVVLPSVQAQGSEHSPP